MRQTLNLILLCCAILFCACGSKNAALYGLQVEDLSGQNVSLADYKGKVLLVVNTATRCGFTPQYEALQGLYETFQNDGLEILDFPCNQFGQQAPGTNQEIHQFCTSTYDITFPQFARIDVNGADESPLFTLLKKEQPFQGFDKQDRMGALLDGMLRKQDPDYDQKADIKWNFTKFLVGRNGKVLRRFEPTVPMEQVKEAVREALGQK